MLRNLTNHVSVYLSLSVIFCLIGCKKQDVKREGFAVIHVEDTLVDVEVFAVDSKTLSLYIGDKKHDSIPVGKGEKTSARLEVSDRIQMDDGPKGHGIICTRKTDGRSTTLYLAITEKGPLPYGRAAIRNSEAIVEEESVVTLADIEQSDGKRIPISLKLE